MQASATFEKDGVSQGAAEAARPGQKRAREQSSDDSDADTPLVPFKKRKGLRDSVVEGSSATAPLSLTSSSAEKLSDVTIRASTSDSGSWAILDLEKPAQAHGDAAIAGVRPEADAKSRWVRRARAIARKSVYATSRDIVRAEAEFPGQTLRWIEVDKARNGTIQAFWVWAKREEKSPTVAEFLDVGEPSNMARLGRAVEHSARCLCKDGDDDDDASAWKTAKGAALLLLLASLLDTVNATRSTRARQLNIARLLVEIDDHEAASATPVVAHLCRWTSARLGAEVLGQPLLKEQLDAIALSREGHGDESASESFVVEESDDYDIDESESESSTSRDSTDDEEEATRSSA